MREVWKPITAYNMFAYDGRYKYEVSNFGNVRKAGYFGYRREYVEPHMMSLRKDRSGYLGVSLVCDCTHHSCLVHKLVATAFIKRPEGFNYVIHLDGDKTNNCVDNLQWSDKSENTTKKSMKFVEKPVRQYTLEGRFVAEYPSISKAAKELGIRSRDTISKVCRRVDGRTTCCGFIWRFTTDDEYAQVAEVREMIDAYKRDFCIKAG